LASADVSFCTFVLALGIVVAGVSAGPIGEHLPSAVTFTAVLILAAGAAVIVEGTRGSGGALIGRPPLLARC